MKAANSDVASLTLKHLFKELRFVKEACSFLMGSKRALKNVEPIGNERPILVLPGFLCNDAATWAMRRYLRALGFRVYAWRLGVNWGRDPQLQKTLLKRLTAIHDREGRKITVIGWSLGGIYARELATLAPDLVDEVITLGSPWHGSPASTSVWRAYTFINRKTLAANDSINVEFESDTVPCMSIYTKSDGIVPWQLSVPKDTRKHKSYEVSGSHIGLVSNAQVMQILTEHLGTATSKPQHAPRLSISSARARTRR